MIVSLIQMILTIVFLCYLQYRYDSLPSISSSWYSLNPRERWMFPVYLFLMGTLTGFHGSIWFILSGFGLWLVAATPYYRWDFQRTAHSLGAMISVLFGALGVVARHEWSFPSYFTLTVLGIATLITVSKLKYRIYYAEVVSIIAILYGLFIGYVG